MSGYFTKIRKVKERGDCVILGNGPSLNPFLEKHFDFLENKKTMCVNFFVRTKEYVKIKPDYYVITSPEYFIREAKANYNESRNETLKQIADRTTWNMTLYVPYLAKKRKAWKKLIKNNPNIKIAYFNNTPIEGFKSFNHFLFRRGLGMPRPHNVLVTSTFLTTSMNFENIYITGSDHSWMKEIVVTKNNDVLCSQKHFYDKEFKDDKVNNSELKPMYMGASENRKKVHDAILKYYYTFRSYWEIKAYAESKGIKIFNLTLDSYIDAFDKIDLDKN